MKAKPMGMLLMILAGWTNRHQQDVIVYFKEENRILREKLGTKRILLNDRASGCDWRGWESGREDRSWPRPAVSSRPTRFSDGTG